MHQERVLAIEVWFAFLAAVAAIVGTPFAYAWVVERHRAWLYGRTLQLAAVHENGMVVVRRRAPRFVPWDRIVSVHRTVLSYEGGHGRIVQLRCRVSFGDLPAVDPLRGYREAPVGGGTALRGTEALTLSAPHLQFTFLDEAVNVLVERAQLRWIEGRDGHREALREGALSEATGASASSRRSARAGPSPGDGSATPSSSSS